MVMVVVELLQWRAAVVEVVVDEYYYYYWLIHLLHPMSVEGQVGEAGQRIISKLPVRRMPR